MQRYLNFAHETESKNRAEVEKMCKLVIKELENRIGYKFDLSVSKNIKISYLHVVTTILLLPDYLEYREILTSLLKENNVNEKGLLFHLLGVINQYDSTLSYENVRNKLITSFSTLPYHEKINFNNELIELQTKYGNIKVYRYDKVVTKQEVYKIMQTRHLANHCHVAVQALKNCYPTDYIITSEIPTLFNGYMYHSYFNTNDGIVDIANNMFFPNDEFNKLFEPKEILKVRTTEFDKQYKKFLLEENVTSDSSVAPVLALALNNKMKGIK